MLLGYNTNGLAHHSLPAAIELLADVGYQSVAITIDYHALNPFDQNFQRELGETRDLLAKRGLRSAIETGARYLLNPREKHEPTLVSPDPADRLRRIDFLRRAIDAAAALASDCVSLWSGVVRHSAGRDQALADLASGLRRVLDYADQRGIMLGFEPEPGMLIDTMIAFDELAARVDSPRLGVQYDPSNAIVGGYDPIRFLDRVLPRVVTMHASDRWLVPGATLAELRQSDGTIGYSDKLKHGEVGKGMIDYDAIFSRLARAGFSGWISIEDGMNGLDEMQRSAEFLRRKTAEHYGDR
jgi:sugar phosphate isomerase/epimerase